MATYSKIKLSQAGSTNGAITISPSNASDIHNFNSNTNVLDEVWLWVSNQSGTDCNYARIRMYDNGSMSYLYTLSEISIPAYSSVLVLGGHVLASDGTSNTYLRVQNSSGSVSLSAYGYVNRITQ